MIIQSNQILTQNQINKLKNLGESRRKSQCMLYDKLINNNIVQDLIRDLSENYDE